MCDHTFSVQDVRQSLVAMMVIPTAWLVGGFIALTLYSNTDVAMILIGCAAGSLLAGGSWTWWKLRR